MGKDDIDDTINELIQECNSGNSGEKSADCKRSAEPPKRAQANREGFEKSINSLQESLDYLRVCIKYQIFDLEATRRENAYLRKLLEELGNEGEPRNGEFGCG